MKRRFDWTKDLPDLLLALDGAMRKAGLECRVNENLTGHVVNPNGVTIQAATRREGTCDRDGIGFRGDAELCKRAAVFASTWLARRGIETCSAGCFSWASRPDVAPLGESGAIVVLRSFVIGD